MRRGAGGQRGAEGGERGYWGDRDAGGTNGAGRVEECKGESGMQEEIEVQGGARGMGGREDRGGGRELSQMRSERRYRAGTKLITSSFSEATRAILTASTHPTPPHPTSLQTLALNGVKGVTSALAVALTGTPASAPGAVVHGAPCELALESLSLVSCSRLQLLYLGMTLVSAKPVQVRGTAWGNVLVL